MSRLFLAITVAEIMSGPGSNPGLAQFYDYPGAYARRIAPPQPAHGQRVAPSQYVNSFECIPSSCPTAAHSGIGLPANAFAGTQRVIGAGMVIPAIPGLTPSPSGKVR